MVTSPVPASSNGAGGFPALRSPACFAVRVLRPVMLGALSAWRGGPVVVEQLEFVIEPAPTPPLPAETFSASGPHQLSSHLLLHPVFDEAKTPTGVTKGKVVHPAAQNRVDELHHPSYRLGVETSGHIFELAQQDGALRELGRIIRLPLALLGSVRAATHSPGIRSSLLLRGQPTDSL